MNIITTDAGREAHHNHRAPGLALTDIDFTSLQHIFVLQDTKKRSMNDVRQMLNAATLNIVVTPFIVQTKMSRCQHLPPLEKPNEEKNTMRGNEKDLLIDAQSVRKQQLIPETFCVFKKYEGILRSRAFFKKKGIDL